MVLSLLALTAYLLVAPPNGAAQAALPAYWEALERAETPAALAAVPRPSLTGAAADVAEGMLGLRRYELGRDRTDAFVARRLLERTIERAPGDAWAHFALGALLVRGPDGRVVVGEDRAQYVIDAHSNAALQAPRVLRRALELQPSLHVAAYVFAEYALDMGALELLQESLQQLTSAGRAREPRALLLRSEILARLGALDSARDVADSVAAVGGDAALSAHARAAAELRQANGAERGAATYFEGVALLTPAAAPAYFYALSALTSAPQQEAWHAADLAEKRAWLHSFWDVQAALAGVSVPARLAEHYRRLALVRARGRRAIMGGPGPGSAGDDVRAQGVSTLADLLILRHGDPLRAHRVLSCGKDVLEIPLALAPSPEACAQSPISRMRMANAAYAGGMRLARDRATDTALRGTSYDPPFRTHLEITHDMLQFRGVGGRTDVVAALALPVSSARALMDSPLRLQATAVVALIDTATSRVQRSEIPLAYVAAQLPEQGWVLLSGTLSAEPRASQLYRVTLTNRDATAGRVVGGSLDVRSYARDDLDMSDVVIAPQDGTRSFVRGDRRISLAPGRELRRDETFTLYYELYGIAAEESYRTELVIEPAPSGVRERIRALFPDAPRTLRLTFQDAATDVHPLYGVQEQRTVDVGGLPPGAYRLRVTVTHARGAVITREQMLYVAGESASQR